jgi:hypothetical protein
MRFPQFYTSFLSILAANEDGSGGGGRATPAPAGEESLFHWMEKNPKAHKDAKLRQEFAQRLILAQMGYDHDLLTKIGCEIFGIDTESLLDPTTATTTTIEARIVESASKKQTQKKRTNNNDKVENETPPVFCDFDFMSQFMKDVFMSYGVSEERAAMCADVLVESDRRGIDSHGVGRLKPVYCDRIDSGILKPDVPIDVIRETETTALLDGNLGLGLYIAPYCMQMAIDKAKKHGVGFVVVRTTIYIYIYILCLYLKPPCWYSNCFLAVQSLGPQFNTLWHRWLLCYYGHPTRLYRLDRN